MHRSKLQLVVILSLLHLSSFLCVGHECGENPMKRVLLIAKATGRTLGSVLSLLKQIDNPAYENLSHNFRTYATCVGLVDTGYFRKRSSVSYEPQYYWDYQQPEEELEPNPGYLMNHYERDPQFPPKRSMTTSIEKKKSRKISVDRLKKWLYGPYRNYMNSYYLRWNLLWPLVNEE